MDYLKTTSDIRLKEFFLYDLNLEELNELSLMFNDFSHMTSTENSTLTEIFHTFAKYELGEAYDHLNEEKLKDALLDIQIILAAELTICKLALLNKIKFEQTHLHPEQWVVSLI